MIHFLLDYCRVEAHRERRRRRAICERGNDLGVRERERREVPRVVRGWIHPDLVFEPSGIDLVIIGGIAPATNTGRRAVKGGIEYVKHVWMKLPR